MVSHNTFWTLIDRWYLCTHSLLMTYLRAPRLVLQVQKDVLVVGNYEVAPGGQFPVTIEITDSMKHRVRSHTAHSLTHTHTHTHLPSTAAD